MQVDVFIKIRLRLELVLWQIAHACCGKNKNRSLLVSNRMITGFISTYTIFTYHH